MHSETTTNVNEYNFLKNNQIMKHSFKFYLLGGAFLLSLSMCLTSCEDVLGHWEKPTPKIPEFNVTSISLDKTSLVLYKDGGENTATLTPTLVGSPGLHKVFFSSSRPWVATVDEETGEVTAVDGGETTITASIGDLYVDCEVKVYHKKHDISTGNADIPANERWEITGTSDTYKITIEDEATAVLNGVNITSNAGSCIETSGTTGSNIILVDGTENKMTTTHDGSAAINTVGGQLNIFGQTKGTGKLIANGGNYGAGIGSSKNSNGHAITIVGGEIIAEGGQYAAGIGAGYGEGAPSTCGFINILGGQVTATGGEKAAGIGTGYANNNTDAKSLCGIITIYNSIVSVTATKGTGATYPIGKGYADGSGTSSTGKIYFGANEGADPGVGPVADDDGDYSPAPADGNTYGGLKLAISGNTWTLTPTN